MNENEIVKIYTDGACKGNPGKGGWGVLLRYKQHEKKLYGGAKETTNNRMELQAVIEGLNALTRPSVVRITTDSKYVQNGMTKWIEGWKKRQWRTSNKQPVKNKDLWEQLDQVVAKHQVEWFWVKGHSGHIENEIADQLANQGVLEA